MAYSTLTAAIRAAIKNNDNEEITGNVLQGVLLSIVNTVGSGYNFAGVATPSTNPGTPDGAMFWIGGKGTYTNFGSTITVAAGSLGIFMWDGSAFTRTTIKLSDGGGIFDVTAYTGNSYASLSAALAAVPQDAKAGGMTIRFVQSSDNKYIQARFMLSGSFTNAQFTNVANWQGVDDEPTVGSENLVKSGGVYSKYNKTIKGISDDSSADLNLGDENGYVILQLKDGHIKTKNFDSRAALNNSLSVKTVENSDLDFGDGNGYVILQLKDGHIKTKNFDSRYLNLITQQHFYHYSFDDVSNSLVDLFSNENYTSLYDSPFFAFLKRLHDLYDTKFTMNMFVSTFSIITNQFAAEFGAASNWLKWTLHGDINQNYGPSGGENPGGRTTGAQDWSDMVNAVITLAGTSDAIDRHTRLSNFAGTNEQIIAMRNAPFGIIALSASETEDRLSYDLDTNEQSFVYNNGNYYSSKNNIEYIRSHIRSEALSWTDNVKTEVLSYANRYKFSEFFMHEYAIVSSSGVLNETWQYYLEEFCKTMYQNNIKSAFYKKLFNLL